MAGIPPTHKIVFVAGDAVKFKFQVTDKDLDNPASPPVPRNLTGWTAWSQIRRTSTSAEVETEWEIGTLGTDGIITMHLNGDITQPWSAVKTLISDVQLTDPTGDPETVLTINLEVSQDVTHE